MWPNMAAVSFASAASHTHGLLLRVSSVDQILQLNVDVLRQIRVIGSNQHKKNHWRDQKKKQEGVIAIKLNHVF